MAIQAILAGLVFIVGNHDGQGPDLGNGIHAPVFFRAKEDYPFEMGEFFRFQVAALAGFQLRHQFIYSGYVIRVLVSVNEKEVFTVRLG